MELNHAMIYSTDVSRAVAFYRDRLGLTLLEEYRAGGRVVYARLRCPNGSSSTIALHQVDPGETLHTGGIRLYFEVPELDRVCRELQQAGVVFSKLPADMPWGWRHAYLDDPDGHEVSLYWAGDLRLRSSV